MRCVHSSLNESVCQECVFTVHGRTLALFRTSRASLISLSLAGFSERRLSGEVEENSCKHLCCCFLSLINNSTLLYKSTEERESRQKEEPCQRWVAGLVEGVLMFAECFPLLGSCYVSTTILLNPASSAPFMCNSSCKWAH